MSQLVYFEIEKGECQNVVPVKLGEKYPVFENKRPKGENGLQAFFEVAGERISIDRLVSVGKDLGINWNNRINGNTTSKIYDIVRQTVNLGKNISEENNAPYFSIWGRPQQIGNELIFESLVSQYVIVPEIKGAKQIIRENIEGIPYYIPVRTKDNLTDHVDTGLKLMGLDDYLSLGHYDLIGKPIEQSDLELDASVKLDECNCIEPIRIHFDGVLIQNNGIQVLKTAHEICFLYEPQITRIADDRGNDFFEIIIYWNNFFPELEINFYNRVN